MRDARPARWSRWPPRALLLYPVVSDNLYYQNMIILSLVFAIGAVGLNVISGYGGYVSLGQGAFLGLGAYTLAILSTARRRLGVGLGAGRRASWPASFAALLGRDRAAHARARVRDHDDRVPVPAADRGHELEVADRRHGGHHAAAAARGAWTSRTGRSTTRSSGLLASSLLMSWRIRRTKFGMGLVAMREDEDKAATVGVDTPIYKLLGFVASAVFVGMAGAVYGYYLAFVDPIGMFNILLSVQILLSMLLGGRGTLFGPVLGAFLIEPLNEYSQQPPRRRQRAAADLRRADGARGHVPAARDHPRRCAPDAGAPARARQGRRVGARLELRERAPPTRRPALSGRTLLEVRGLEKRFGGLRAVDGASFAVPEGSITALIGPNGSGKTTVFNLIGGTMAAERRRGLVRRPADRRLKPWAARLRRDRPHVPDHAAVPRDDRARERRRAAARLPLGAAQRRRRVRRGGRARRGAARLRRA